MANLVFTPFLELLSHGYPTITAHRFHLLDGPMFAVMKSLSFRGRDVRSNFFVCLHESLIDSGIYAFIDRERIEMAKKIMEKIFQVIRHTETCIPIFSKDFASCKSRLKEVVEMVECNKTIMPIFYDVSPLVVSKQEESYQQSFCTHAALGEMSGTIDNWMKALHTLSGMRGWELEKFNYEEHELINEVVSMVRRLLRKDDLYGTAHSLRMDQPVQEVMNVTASFIT